MARVVDRQEDMGVPAGADKVVPDGVGMVVTVTRRTRGLSWLVNDGLKPPALPGQAVGDGVYVRPPWSDDAMAGREDGDEGLDQRGIELYPRAAPQLGDDVLGRQAAPIRPVERHRGDGIGDLHDSGQQRGLRAGHAVGVAAAIVALVMVRHDVQHRGVVDEAADDGDAVDHAA